MGTVEKRTKRKLQLGEGALKDIVSILLILSGDSFIQNYYWDEGKSRHQLLIIFSQRDNNAHITIPIYII